MTKAATVDPREIEQFSRIAEEWWDESGKFRPLHRINPVRIAYIRDHLIRHFELDAKAPKPLKGLKLLDIGCGGGLICEPMARLGADVTGIDASERNIQVARLHAEQSGLAIDYRHTSVESLEHEHETYDVVLTLEIIEHVAEPALFMEHSCALVKPGGAMFLSTLNRTAKAFALAIVGAEYILRWLPRGTHSWRKFLKPSEIAAFLRRSGMELADETGMVFNPFTDSWSLNPRDMDVNYLMFATKPHSLDSFIK